MRGRVVDLQGAVSDHNAMCQAKMPATRDLTDTELDALTDALIEQGVDVQGNPSTESTRACVVVAFAIVAALVFLVAILSL